jgi:hypothetical protein
VDVFSRKPYIGGCGLRLQPFSAGTLAAALRRRYFTALLRRIVLFGDPTLRSRFNLGCVSMGAVGGADDFVVSLFRLATRASYESSVPWNDDWAPRPRFPE